MEIAKPRTIFAGFGEDGDLPVLPPIVAHEPMTDGWRGLTADGEVLEIRGSNGHRASVPENELIVMREGQAVGRRAIKDPGNVSYYLSHYNTAIEFYRYGQCETALAEIDAAIASASTVRARFNRALILLAMGRWREGFAQYEDRFDLSGPAFPPAPAGVPRWRGENIAGKRLLLLHEQGFGDSIMMLRYVPALRAMGADVVLDVPAELARLAGQLAPVMAASEARADFFCPFMSLLHVLDATPQTVPRGPYLAVDRSLVAQWRERLPSAGCRRVGIAWSVSNSIPLDFPRAIPLGLLVGGLGYGIDLYSIQKQGANEAGRYSVKAFPLADFADVAALISLMDEIVAVDTAALHVAGAIGHGNVTALLSHWCSWRWRDNPFYPTIRLCRQVAPGDWNSALAQIKERASCQ